MSSFLKGYWRKEWRVIVDFVVLTLAIIGVLLVLFFSEIRGTLLAWVITWGVLGGFPIFVFVDWLKHDLEAKERHVIIGHVLGHIFPIFLWFKPTFCKFDQKVPDSNEMSSLLQLEDRQNFTQMDVFAGKQYSKCNFAIIYHAGTFSSRFRFLDAYATYKGTYVPAPHTEYADLLPLNVEAVSLITGSRTSKTITRSYPDVPAFMLLRTSNGDSETMKLSTKFLFELTYLSHRGTKQQVKELIETFVEEVITRRKRPEVSEEETKQEVQVAQVPEEVK
jgi:hypothetical protein